jgi:hypothetical protein
LRRIAIDKNETYPWKTEDHTLGLHAHVNLLPSFIDEFESHPSYEFFGINYQFHDPFELPSDENPRFVSHVGNSLLFFVATEFTELGETLTNYKVDK